MTDTTDTIVEVMARAIAQNLGDDYDSAFESKSQWVADRGMRGGRFRDVNEPYQSDYDDAARAAIAAALTWCANEAGGAVIGYINPDPDGNRMPAFATAAIRTRFDELAKEIGGSNEQA